MAKILIIYDSETNNDHVLAEEIGSVLEKLQADVRVRRVVPVSPITVSIEEKPNSVSVVTKEDVVWAEGYVLVCPIHTGTFSAAMKYFIDEYHGYAVKGFFLNKPLTAMTVGKIYHAGAETIIQHLYSTVMHWGVLIVPTSIIYGEINGNNGNPYGLSFLVDQTNKLKPDKKMDEVLNIHLNRFAYIVDVCKDISIGAAQDKLDFPLTISDALNKY